MNEFPPSSFRHWLDLDHPRYPDLQNETAASHTDKVLGNIPGMRERIEQRQKLWQDPFQGITSDGNPIQNLYPSQDDDIPIQSMVSVAISIIETLDDKQRQQILYAIDAPKRRAWSNPELYIHRFGIRLEETTDATKSAVLELLKVTLSPEGYQKALSAMEINHFLGELVNARGVMNRYSYNFMLFGTPSPTKPWAWLLYGHHLCLSAFVHRTQIILTPTFTGAEPNLIDEGPFKGTQILIPEQNLGLRFMQSLAPEFQQKAQIFKVMESLPIPEWRFNRADQRHLCGAFQDNRIVPYEGVCLSELDSSFGALILEIVEQFCLYLPEKARKNRLTQVKKHISATYFCWIGGFGADDPFYFRIQSPVIIAEFDHHSGVFLANKEPRRFHIHTIVRSPNGGDYGYALL